MDHQQVTRFTSLWTQTQSSVLAFISATVTNFSDAEDLLQRVASVAVNKFHQFDAEGDSKAFAGWTVQIAKFEVLNHLRSLSTDRHQFLADSVGVIADSFEEISGKFDDRRHALGECIREIQGRPRDVLAKRYGEGLKTGAIAAQLGLTPGNVSVILNRTYKTLRQCIDSRLAGGTR